MQTCVFSLLFHAFTRPHTSFSTRSHSQKRDDFGLPRPWLVRGLDIDDSSWRMLECLPDSEDFQMIQARLKEEMGGDLVTVSKVEMNANVDLLRRFDLERNKVRHENGGDANEVWAWHASKSCPRAEDSILKEGFDISRCGLDFEYYGAGIYLALDSKLSDAYASSQSRPNFSSSRCAVYGCSVRSCTHAISYAPLCPGRCCWCELRAARSMSAHLSIIPRSIKRSCCSSSNSSFLRKRREGRAERRHESSCASTNTGAAHLVGTRRLV